jgi:hypothetical protein
MTHLLHARRITLPQAFAALQVGAIMGFLFFGVISRPRQLLATAMLDPNVSIDFQTVTLALADYFVAALLIATVVRLLIDTPYRQRLLNTLQKVYTAGALWWAALVGWMAVGIFWAVAPVLTRYDLIHAVAALVMAILVADWVSQEGFVEKCMLWALLAAAVVQSTIALLQVANRGPLGLWSLGEIPRFDYDPTNFYRAPGLSMHPNYFGGFMLLCLFTCLLTGYYRWSQKRTVYGLVIIGLLIGMALVATLSRSAILGTAVACLPLIWAALGRANRRVRLGLLAALGVVALGAVIWAGVVVAGDWQTRFFGAREFFFADTFQVLKQHPWLGVGADNIMVHVVLLNPDANRPLLPVHNVYLYLWTDLGLPGLILFLIGCGVIVRQAFKLNHNTVNIPVLLWASCLLGIAVIALFDNYFWAVHPFRDFAFWALGVWWGLVLRAQSETTPTPS